MKKILFLLFILISDSFASSQEFSGTWFLSRDHILDGEVKLLKSDEINLKLEVNSHHNKFSAKYIGLDNDSIFTGETLSARKTTLIHFFQYDDSFYVIHNGHKIFENHYVGTWFASGNLSGDFELKKK